MSDRCRCKKEGPARRRDTSEKLVTESTAALEAANTQLREEVAERAQTEAALRESQESLQHANEELEVANEELRVTNQQLRESEEALRRQADLLDLSYEAIFSWELGGAITFWNRGAEEVYGYGREEAVGQVSHDLLRTEHPQGLDRILLQLVKRTRWAGELVHTTKDGRRITVESRWQLVEDRSGRRAVLEIARDITARKQAEEALQESKESLQESNEELEVANEELTVTNQQLRASEEARRGSEARLRSLFANMLDGYAYCRMRYEDNQPVDFIYLDVNPSFGRLTGLHDVVGKPVSEVVPGLRETNPEVFAAYGRVARGGAPERLEVYVPGLHAWLSIAVYSPAPDHFVAVFDNITARKQAEQARQESEESLQQSNEELEVANEELTVTNQQLRESEEALRERERDLARAQAAAHLGSWTWDLTTDTVTWSEELYRIFDVDPKTFVPSNEAANQMLHPDDRAQHAHLVGVALTGQQVPPFESRIIRPNGEVRVTLASGFEAAFDAAGRPVRLFGTVLDITDRKEAEEERAQLAAQLLAAERARAEIAERLTAEINHRMKNNLTLLAGVLTVQAMGLPGEGAPGRALRGAITRLAALSAIHEQLYEAGSARVDLRDVLQRIAGLDVQALAVGEVDVQVRGDRTSIPSKLGSALALVGNELITNALQFGALGDGGVREIEVQVSRSAEGLCLQVWNSGNPVPEGFEVSEQAGVGLGLVQSVIVQQFQGSFALRPEPGGTMAEVFVPEREIQASEFVPVGEGRATPSV